MKNITVKQLAAISGVTVRTLHHYDEIGLLRPASVGANGYRYYGRAEQLRLQRILFHRELGVPLGVIPGLLLLEVDDQIGALKQHRENLTAERERYRILIDTIDRTIHELQGDNPMNNADLYKGFSAEKQAGYEAWLIEHFGEPMREALQRSKKSFAKMSAAEKEALGRECQDIEQSLAAAQREGTDPASDKVGALIHRHRAWVSAMWGAHCSAERYMGLADGYLSHPDFVARYEAIEAGFAEFLSRAMKIHAIRWTQT